MKNTSHKHEHKRTAQHTMHGAGSWQHFFALCVFEGPVAAKREMYA